MWSDLDGQSGLVGLQCPIQVSDGDLLVVVFAAGTRVFVGWTAGSIFSLDEEVTGAGVDVEVVVESSDVHGESEVVAHVVEFIVFGGRLVGKMGGGEMEGPHVMPHAVLLRG